MLALIITAIYFYLPAYIANMCPVLAGKAKMPLGMSIHKKAFGKNKTWRGFYTAYIGALLILALQLYFQRKGLFIEYLLLDYENINIFFYAFLFGIGALTGDLIKSFFKRRLGIKSGAPFIPFDQIDFVLISSLFIWPSFPIPWQIFIIALIVTPFLHFLTNVLAYFLGLKKVWW